MGLQFRDTQFVLHRKGREDTILEAANQDLTDSTYQYFGYMNTEGFWVVQRFHIVGSAIVYEYAAGQSATVYAALWNGSGIYVGALTFYPINTFLSHLQ